MKIFYAETGVGCCIREAKTIETARACILAEVGASNGIRLLRVATVADVDHILRNGGKVPNNVLTKIRLEKAYSDSMAICSPAMISGLR